ncbi:hypothetical protein ACFPA1_08495 [Neobacillus sp. GCM10023253]
MKNYLLMMVAGFRLFLKLEDDVGWRAAMVFLSLMKIIVMNILGNLNFFSGVEGIHSL